MLDPARWQRVHEVCHAALQKEGVERSSYLDEACRGDEDLRREVETLIALDAGASRFLEPPPSAAAAEILSSVGDPCLSGRRLGAYLLGGILGRGGMGVVYEAEQESPRRSVALKLLRALPFFDEEAFRLFRREAQALARLSHPGIAAIHEAGRTDEGWYYFAMERVDGLPLRRFSSERALSLRARLELFARVCAAVHYAHQRGVIHRDLKPSNILVTPDGLPKVLDFGLAKVLDPGEESAYVTRSGTFQGTLAYASPEQASGRAGEVDARSDVYSLGVILHELLTDQLPHAVSGLPLLEGVRVICETPARPLGSVRRELRGELEIIVRKALEKAPLQRYSSAAALGEDIERYLCQQPILAQPPSTLYEVRKLVRRHRLTFSLATAFIVLLAASVVVTTWLAVRAARERDVARAAETRATEARDAAEQFASFLERLFERADPRAEPTKDRSLRQVLDEGHARLAEVENPLVRARLRTALGKVYTQLNEFPRARELLQSALETRQSLLGPDHPELAETIAALARLLTWMHQPGASDLARSLIDIRRRQLGPDHTLVAEAWSLLGEGRYYEGDYPAAIEAFRVALEIHRRGGGAGPRKEIAGALSDLGFALTFQGHAEEGEQILREAWAMYEKLGDLSATLNALEGVAQAVWRRDTCEAERIYAEELELTRKAYSPGHAKLSWVLRNYAYTVRHNQGPAAAEPLQREALEIARAAFGSLHSDVAQCLEHLAATLRQEQRGEEAAVLLAEAAEIYLALFGPDDRRTENALRLLEGR